MRTLGQKKSATAAGKLISNQQKFQELRKGATVQAWRWTFSALASATR